MANITLSELHVSGSELFQDSENFLNELSDLDSVYGGAAVPGLLPNLSSLATVIQGIGVIIGVTVITDAL